MRSYLLQPVIIFRRLELFEYAKCSAQVFKMLKFEIFFLYNNKIGHATQPALENWLTRHFHGMGNIASLPVRKKKNQ